MRSILERAVNVSSFFAYQPVVLHVLGAFFLFSVHIFSCLLFSVSLKPQSVECKLIPKLHPVFVVVTFVIIPLSCFS